MYARITRVKADPAGVDRQVAEMRAQMIPVFEQQPGYLGVINVANRETGEGATTTYWDSMENLRASEAAIFAARDRFSQEQGAEVISFHRVEIPVAERRAEPKAGTFVRATVLTGLDAGQVEQGIESFRTQIVPKALALPGIRSVVLHVDRENNVGFAVTVYDSAEQRDAAAATLDGPRDEISAAQGSQAETTVGEITYADLKVPVNR